MWISTHLSSFLPKPLLSPLDLCPPSPGQWWLPAWGGREQVCLPYLQLGYLSSKDWRTAYLQGGKTAPQGKKQQSLQGRPPARQQWLVYADQSCSPHWMTVKTTSLELLYNEQPGHLIIMHNSLPFPSSLSYLKLMSVPQRWLKMGWELPLPPPRTICEV
jgi:hypothetical protein